MTKIDLTTPSQRELFGMDTVTVLTPSQQSKKGEKRSRWGREDARQMILRACSYRELTIREIAKELDRAKTPYLYALVYEMCNDGLLTARQDVTYNKLTVYKFIAR